MRLVIVLALAAYAADTADLFTYDRKLPNGVRETGSETRDGITVRDVTFANLSGGRTAAYLVSPPGKGKFAGVLFVHWYEPESKNSNRTQFIDEAVTLAKAGTVSLLIETMWSDPKWFPSRKREEDYEHSVQQVKDLRRALDVLLAQPGVDPRRVGFVGHDFGAMFGALLPPGDKRISAYALQAGTSKFPNWYLYGPPMEPEARRKFIEQLAPLDPAGSIGAASPAPVLFQFGRNDRHVPEPKANEFYAAAREPKKILWYDAGHALNSQANADRIAWLKEQLKLK